MSAPAAVAPSSAREQQFLRWYLAAMVVLAWAAVLSGAYVIYPWYRAVPPAGGQRISAVLRRQGGRSS
jgi:hypothetical protein